MASTYAERVNILKYVKSSGKWRFAPVARRTSGSIHWDNVLIGGTTEHHPEGKYFIEWREEGVRRRKSVGVIPSEILAEAQRQRALLDAKSAGIEVLPPNGASPKSQTLVTDAMDRYLRDVEMNKSRSTFTHYKHCLGLFKQSLTKGTIEAIDRDDLMDFQAFLYKQKLSARTVKHKTIIVASFLKTVGREKLLNKGDWPKYTEEDPESYTQEELKKFFAACNDDEYLLFQFFLHSGFRDQEVRHLHWDDLDFENGTAKVKSKTASRTQAYSFDPKSRRSREVPLPDGLLMQLKARKKTATTKLVFPSRPHWKAPKARPGGKPSDEFLDYCKAVALRAGLNCGDCENSDGEICAAAPCCERFYLHKFRATFATMHLRSGVDILTVSRWLGHKDLKTTMRYLTVAHGKDVRKQVNGGLLASSFAPPARRRLKADRNARSPRS